MEAPRIIKNEDGCAVAMFSGVGTLLIIGGIILFWPMIIAGLLCFIIAACMGKRSVTCGACGNTVAETSRLCPTCRAELYEYHMSIVQIMVKLAWITLAIGVILGTLWLIYHPT